MTLKLNKSKKFFKVREKSDNSDPQKIWTSSDFSNMKKFRKKQFKLLKTK